MEACIYLVGTSNDPSYQQVSFFLVSTVFRRLALLSAVTGQQKCSAP